MMSDTVLLPEIKVPKRPTIGASRYQKLPARSAAAVAMTISMESSSVGSPELIMTNTMPRAKRRAIAAGIIILSVSRATEAVCRQSSPCMKGTAAATNRKGIIPGL